MLGYVVKIQQKRFNWY